jgi:hypothetical protein
MISDRQALLQRAKQRIQEKRLLQQAALGEVDPIIPRVPLDIQPLPSPTSRYRRASLSHGLDIIPAISETVKPVADIPQDDTRQDQDVKPEVEIAVAVKQPVLKPGLYIDTGTAPVDSTPKSAMLSSTKTKAEFTVKTPKSVERILEHGVTISPTETYLGLAVTPMEPLLETDVDKKRKFHLLKRTKRQPIPDELPIKQEGKKLYLNARD